MPVGWHVTYRLDSDQVIAPRQEELARAGRILARLARDWPLLSWSTVDTHGHTEVLGERDEVGELVRRLLIALSRALRLPTRFQPARFTPIRDQRHLENTFWYVGKQARHHGVDLDPWQLGSAAPLLAGLRWDRAGLGDRVARHLPRVRLETLREELGWSGYVPSELGEGPGELELLGPAAAGAVGHAHLEGRSNDIVQARAAAAQLAAKVVPQTEVARALHMSPRSVYRALRRPAPPDLLDAVRNQWAWRVERCLHGRPSSTTPRGPAERGGLSGGTSRSRSQRSRSQGSPTPAR